MPKFIITTVSSFLHKYAIEAETVEHAMDEFVMLEGGGYKDTFSDVCEIKQKFISEDIAEAREATDEQIVAEADEYMQDFVLSRVRKVTYEK